MKKEEKEREGRKDLPIIPATRWRGSKEEERKEEKNRDIKTHGKATKTPAVVQQTAKQPQKKTTDNCYRSASSRKTEPLLSSTKDKLTELRDGRVQLWRRPASGVQLLHLCGRNRLVRLAGGSIHGLHPQDPVLLVVTGKDHGVALFHGVKEGSTSFQTC